MFKNKYPILYVQHEILVLTIFHVIFYSGFFLDDVRYEVGIFVGSMLSISMLYCLSKWYCEETKPSILKVKVTCNAFSADIVIWCKARAENLKDVSKSMDKTRNRKRGLGSVERRMQLYSLDACKYVIIYQFYCFLLMSR